MTTRLTKTARPRQQKPLPPQTPACGPHDVEAAVQRSLLSEPSLTFHSLVVRRTRNGVCLQGIVEGEPGTDISSLARRVQGVDEVINQLLRSDRSACEPAQTLSN